ncbi:hypothetical protein CVV68_10560 [Arthrobacter livingstonensis]|uniref:Uncharacterized protein n=1 Tax=Arthrobacter livingstonensis TaxID=670078 RepID=A0A2V5LBM5_9MICC|nr:hypothetical protein CVV68_10560 [Arthrobacter livingstonensis]
MGFLRRAIRAFPTSQSGAMAWLGMALVAVTVSASVPSGGIVSAIRFMSVKAAASVCRVLAAAIFW